MGPKAGFQSDGLIDINYIQLDERSTDKDTPPSGYVVIYGKNDSSLYLRKSTGTVIEIIDNKKVLVSSNDTTENYFPQKLEEGAGITLTEMYDGGNEKLKMEVNNAVGSSRLCALCGYAGNAGSKYLEWFRNVPGDASPLVVSEPGKLKSYSVSFKTATTCTFSIRKNGTEIKTLTVTSDNRGYAIDDVNEVAAGDELTVYVSSGSPQDVNFVLSELVYI